MKWAVYNLLFAAIYPFLLPGFLRRMRKRGGYAARLGDRFALYPRDILSKFIPDGAPVGGHESQATSHESRTTNFVWIHAVSVGEVQVAGQLMREWRQADPSVRFCFSTTSSTGWKIAERELAQLPLNSCSTPAQLPQNSCSTPDVLIYNPLDFPNFVKSALKTVRPRAIVLTESEIWPNFILRAKKMGIPLFLINARVSDRSAPRYKFARFFFKDVFGAFTKIFAQSDLDAERIRAAMRPEDAAKVVVTGSFKFDVAKRNEAKEKELREWIFGDGKKVEKVGGGGQRKVILGGSTWPGEDKVLLDIYKNILSGTEHSALGAPLLVLAPRHFEKADEVEANIKSAGFTCIRRSRGESATSQLPLNSRSTSQPVFLADTTGEMMGLFGICDLAFVGKSLCEHGSQNMIEPCLCGKPTFVGPFTENFRPVMSDLLAANAIVQVKDAEELKVRMTEFLKNGTLSAELGERAKSAVLNRQGVVPRCVTAIRTALS